MDPEQKFNQHVELIVNKANMMLGLIRSSFTFLDGPTVKKLYSSLGRPILEYGNVIWAQHSRGTKGCLNMYNEEQQSYFQN